MSIRSVTLMFVIGVLFQIRQIHHIIMPTKWLIEHGKDQSEKSTVVMDIVSAKARHILPAKMFNVE